MDLPFREDQQKISYRKKKLQNVVYGMKTFEWSSILQKILQRSSLGNIRRKIWKKLSSVERKIPEDVL